MRLILITTFVLLPLVLAPAAEAGPQWLPVCKDKDVRAGDLAHLHVGVDCYPGVYAEICPPGEECVRHDVGDLR